MAKYITLILLLAVAVSWSHAKIAKREAIDDDTLEEVTREIFAEVLLLGAKPEEEPILIEKFKEAQNQEFDTTEDYAKHLVKIFEEVTGRSFSLDDSVESDESSAESAESPVAGIKAIEV